MPHDFPQQPTPLIGRDAAVGDILRLLADPACRLLTLMGVGGIGKTRLAIEAAGRAAASFQDGAHFVALQPLASIDALIPTLANALGLKLFGGSDPRQQVIDYLQNRHLLLVIDNFEHLLDSVDLLVDLLAAPQIKLLVTSREALRVREEWLYAVAGLSVPSGHHDDPIETYGAVQLFVEQVRRLRHNFALNDYQADVTRICQLTEGLPLALELAAGWVKLLTPAQIATEMQTSLDFLTTTVRNVPARHRSMTAAFAQSWRLLGEDEARVFRRLSIFRGGFTREAAEQVVGASLPILAALVDKSLLRVNPSGRYEVHELLRQFGEQQLEASGEMGATRDAHHAYYLDFLAQRSETIHTQRMIEVDFENIRTAWYWAVDHKHDAAISHAVEALTWYCDRRDRFLEHDILYSHAQQAFAPASGEKPLLIWGQLLSRRAAVLMQYNTSDDAILLAQTWHTQSLDVAYLHEHPFEIGYALMRWGSYLALIGNSAALAPLEESLKLFQGLDNRFYISECCVWMGYHHRNLNHVGQALNYFKQAADLKRQLGDQNGEGWTLKHMSVFYSRLGRQDDARIAAHEALRLMSKIGHQVGVGVALSQLGMIAFYGGDFDTAWQFLARARQSIVNTQVYETNFSSLALSLNMNSIVAENYAQIRQEFDDIFTKNIQLFDFQCLIVFSGLGQYQQAKEFMLRRVPPAYPLLTASELTFMAIILAHQGEPQHAVRLFSLVMAQPLDITGWVRRWGLVTRLLDRLKSELGDEAYQVEWALGVSLDGEAEVQTLRQKWSSQPTAKARSTLLDALTERETEVLHLVADGLSNAEIAQKLYLTVGTVKVHTRNIYGKLGVVSRTQAVARARELNFL